VFRWASLSKGVAATLVAGLAEEKKLSLSDPAGRYAPSLKLPEGGERTATIADLLSHRVGLVKNAYDDKLEEGVDPHLIRTELGALPAYCKPGTCHAYQNVAYDAASEIVETVTHQSYATQAKKRLFAPLGMDGASLGKAGLESSPSWARPHRGRHMLTVEDAYYRVPAAGGMNSSIFDLGLWMRAQMGLVPAVVPAHVLQMIHAPLVDTDGTRRRLGAYDRAMSDAWYGMGWREFHYQGHLVIGHRGAVSGYRSLILFDPAKKAGVAMLWNSESPKPIPAQMEVLDMLYGLPDHDWLGYGKAPTLAMDNRRENIRSAR
jgi:beta-lactamase class C